MPCIPTPNKWAKLYGCLDFVAMGILVNNFLEESFTRAFQHMQFAEYDPSKLKDADPSLVEGLHFHEVTGKRLLSSLRFLQDEQAKREVLCMTVMSEFLRILHYFWLSCLDRTREIPGLMQALNRKQSPVWQVMQRISQLMHSPGDGRLLFLWKRQGWSSWEA